MRAKSTSLGLIALALCGACGGGAPATPAPAGPVAGDPSLIPTRIGRGPGYAPPARAPRGADCAPGPVAGRSRIHLELFARRRVVLVPAAIGLGPPLRLRSGRIVAARCRAPLRTLDPSGVVDVDGTGRRLGDFFAIWGEPLGPRRLLSFAGAVSVFVDGRRVPGDPAAVALRDGAEIVVEVGGYVPPHRAFRFPPRRVSGRS